MSAQLSNSRTAFVGNLMNPGQPLGPIVIYHPNATATPYNTINSAYSAAASGDVVCSYVNVNYTGNTPLTKNNVGWIFAQGTTLTHNSSSACVTFDDVNSAISDFVIGDKFIRVCNNSDISVSGSQGSGYGGGSTTTGGDVGVWAQRNSGSIRQFAFNEVSLQISGTSAQFVGYQSAIQSNAGLSRITGNRVYIPGANDTASSVLLWWVNGDCRVNIGTWEADEYFVYMACSDSTKGDLYIDYQEMKVPSDTLTGSPSIICACSDSSSAMWLNGQVIRGDSTTSQSATIANQGGKLYLDGLEKLFGRFSMGNQISASQTHVDIQKFTGDLNGSDAIIAIGSTTYGRFNIGKFDPSIAERLLNASAGSTIFISGQDLSVFNGSDGILSTGSGTTVNFTSGIITTDASHKDLVQASSGVINAAPGSYNANKTSGTITGVGQLITGVIASGSATSLVSTTAKTVTSISLGVGEWDISGEVDFHAGTGTTTTYLQAGIGTATNTLGSADTYSSSPVAIATTSIDASQPTPIVRMIISATTTVYLIAVAGFAVSTLTAYGTIRARRIK